MLCLALTCAIGVVCSLLTAQGCAMSLNSCSGRAGRVFPAAYRATSFIPTATSTVSTTGCESSPFNTYGALVVGGGEFCQQSEPPKSVCGVNGFLGRLWWFLWCSPCFPVGVFGLVFPSSGWVLSLPTESDSMERYRVRYGSVGAATCKLRRLANSTPLFLSVRSWVTF